MGTVVPPASGSRSEIVLKSQPRLQALEVAQIERARHVDCAARDLDAQGRRYREFLREPHVRCGPDKQGVAQEDVGTYAIVAADVVSFDAEENTLIDLRCYRR